MLARIVLAIEPPKLQRSIRALIEGPGVRFESGPPRTSPWEDLVRTSADLVIVSRRRIPDPLADSIALLLGSPDAPEVIVIADREDAEERARLLTVGCEAVVPRQVSPETLRELFRTILDRRRAKAEQTIEAAMAAGRPRLSDFVSASPAMQAFMEVVGRIADTDASLLLLGETGVGKERLARAIHGESRRSDGPFVAVNCGALPETLLESELFGHEEGAFTGATRMRRGWFELAHGGTLFLDEIGDMPLHLQVKLLRALQERAIQPLGSEKVIRVDARVMAASNRDLERAVERGEFRGDLYYRLGVVSLTLPALRDRCEDIPALVTNYIDHFSTAIGRDVTGIEESALDALARYSWPGNVRELMNVIERAVLLCTGEHIGLQHLPRSITGAGAGSIVPTAVLTDAAAGPRVPPDWMERPWKSVRGEVVAQVERAYLDALLAATRGRIGETAKRAGMEPRSLYGKMRRHGLRKEDYRTTGGG
jgi:DNA-binding NtrC family response regulator